MKPRRLKEANASETRHQRQGLLRRRRNITRLWIGGSSGLARTYFNVYADEGGDSSTTTNNDKEQDEQDDGAHVHWILLGHEKVAPEWLNATKMSTCRDETSNNSATSWTYICHDLTDHGSAAGEASLDAVLHACHRQDDDLSDIIIGIRPPLVTSRSASQAWTFNQKLLIGLERLLTRLLLVTTSRHCSNSNGNGNNNNNTLTRIEKRRRRLIIHISSVAAVDHVIAHKMRSVESHPDPPSYELQNPYDRFKRASEELVERLVEQCNNNNNTHENNDRSIPCGRWTYTNLRLGAIFPTIRTAFNARHWPGKHGWDAT
jgi:hypothetical protein